MNTVKMSIVRWMRATLGVAGLTVLASSCIALDGALFSSDDVCGNGVVQEAEQCDDGNEFNDDSCLVGCVVATCGDGFVWSKDGGDEQCDLLPVINQDDCDAYCHWCDCTGMRYAPGCFWSCD